MNKIRKKIASFDEVCEDKFTVDRDILAEYGLTDIRLRDYQLDGVRWLCQRFSRGHGAILGDEMGLGKTCQVISFLVYLGGAGLSSGPHLIISPLSVLNNWKTELKRFAPKLRSLCYVGSKEERPALQDNMCNDHYNVIVTTYEMVLKDESFLRRRRWHTLVVDEAHRLKNSQSMLYTTLSRFSFAHHVLLTGTPLQNNIRELYALLSFVAPSVFSPSYTDDFAENFTDVHVNTESSSNEIEDLHDLLRPFLLRRIKSNVLHDLPQKSEVVLYHSLSSLQKKYYKAILTRDIDVFENSQGAPKTRLMNIMMQLRKCVNHPYLFDGVEPEPFVMGDHLIEASGKLLLLDELLGHLRSGGHKVLLFSQMTRMLDIIQDYLGYKGYTYERLDGSVRGEERYLAVQSFNDDDATFIFLLSTKAGGVGLNLTGADTVIFVDSDFNPQNDLQAAARAHRIGQTRDVKVIRLIGRSTVEEIILSRAEQKLQLASDVIEAGQFTTETNKSALIADNTMQLADILKFGVDKLFGEHCDEEELDLDEILGPSVNGQWQTANQPSKQSSDVAGSSDTQSLYVFEGMDYSLEPSTNDHTAFIHLLQAEAVALEETQAESRALRKTKTAVGASQLLTQLPAVRPRKTLTPEQLEERKRKRQENAARRLKEAQEAEERQARLRREKRDLLWKKHGYISKTIPLPSDGESEEESEEDEGDMSGDTALDIGYLVGDVTHPQKTKGGPAIIIHCVDDSGVWGSGGLFSALDAVSMAADDAYTTAGRMKDLSLGDCHLIPLEDSDEDEGSSTQHYVALIVAQSRDRNNRLSGIDLEALSSGLLKIHTAAKKIGASVHMPRIGHNTPGFNWYGTERLIRKHLTSRHTPAYIYYYPRKQALKRKAATVAQVPKRRKSSEDISDEEELSTSTLSRLPDYFTGVKVYFHNVPAPETKKLKRYIIAYNGDVCDACDFSVTHVVTGSPCDKDDEFVADTRTRPDTQIVTVNWLHKCLTKKRLVSTDPYIPKHT